MYDTVQDCGNAEECIGKLTDKDSIETMPIELDKGQRRAALRKFRVYIVGEQMGSAGPLAPISDTDAPNGTGKAQTGNPACRPRFDDEQRTRFGYKLHSR